MSFDWTEQIYPFPVEVGYRALVAAAPRTPFKLQGSDDLRRVVSLKSGASLTSWGERINAQATSRGSNECIIRIECSSSGETWGKTEKNIRLYLQAIDQVLRSSGQQWASELNPPAPSKPDVASESSPKDRLSQLQELLDSGLISQEEYNQKRTDILKNM